VASWLIKPKHRPAIRAFYEFVRVADDIADHPSLGSGDKLVRLDRLEQSLLGKNDDEPEAVALRTALERHGLTSRHAQDLLLAFRQDVTKQRYADWDELIDYCSHSAMPVGRFVLDVHGEPRGTWPASDALCAALQIINHLQDCAVDYRSLDRVYIPLDALASHGLRVEALGENRASPAMRNCLRELATRTSGLLAQSQGLAASVSDTRLAVEISVIQALATRLLARLQARDPLSEPVHLSKAAMTATASGAVIRALSCRMFRAALPSHRYQTP
jgi:squalene synthase HpnC